MSSRTNRGPRRGSNRPSTKRPTKWAFLTAPQGEANVLEEIGVTYRPKRLSDGLILAEGRARRPDGRYPQLTFARAAMSTDGEPKRAEVTELGRALANRLQQTMKKRVLPWTLEITAPALGGPKDPRRKTMQTIDREITEPLDDLLPRKIADAYVDSTDNASWLAQIWLVDRSTALVGLTEVDAVGATLGTGKREGPSATRKLDAAFDWIGNSPGRGEVCAVLEGKRGHWTNGVHELGAKVHAVGPERDKKTKGIQVEPPDPFAYAPKDTLDWLLCDLARRPKETVQLVAKWGRRVWAHQFLLNLKLPMKTKATFLRESIAFLEQAGWRDVRARQLDPSREEAVLFGWLDPRIAQGGWKPPFALRSAQKKQEREENNPRGKPRKRKPQKRKSKSRGRGR